MSIHELITAPWDERDMEAVAKAWPEVQRFYGLDDLPEETEYAGMGSASIESPSFKGYVARPPEQWQCKTTWWGTAVDFHYARVIEKEKQPKLSSAADLLRAEADRLQEMIEDGGPSVVKEMQWAYSVAAAWLDCRNDPSTIKKWQEVSE